MKTKLNKLTAYGMFAVLLAVVLASCTVFLEGGEETIINNDPGGTQSLSKIQFSNPNKFKVDVYSEPNRGFVTKSVSANSTSTDVDWFGGLFTFYMTYLLPIKDASNEVLAELPYIPTISSTVNEVKLEIPRVGSTTVNLPYLTSAIGQNTVIFGNDIYIAVKNSFTSSLQLLSGSYRLTPVNGNSNLINPNQTGLYKINPNTTNVSSFKVLVGATQVDFPTDISSFTNGYLYEYTFYGASSFVFNRHYQLTLHELGVD